MGPNITYCHGDRYGSHWTSELRAGRSCTTMYIAIIPLPHQTSSSTGRRGPRPLQRGGVRGSRPHSPACWQPWTAEEIGMSSRRIAEHAPITCTGPVARTHRASRGSSHDKHPFPDSGNAWGSHAGGNYWNA